MFRKADHLKKLTALLTAGVLTGKLAASVYAAGNLHDLNGDAQTDSADIRLLADHLTCAASLPDSADAAQADFDGNGILNAADLTLLKRILLEPEPEQPQAELIAPPIKGLTGTLPTVGAQKILMFAIEFPDCTSTEDFTTENIHSIVFGPENQQDSDYPLESTAAYYERASYGRLHLDGDVYYYKAKKNINSYTDYARPLLEEVLSAFSQKLDYSKYDSDGNRQLDAVVMVLPNTADKQWRPYTIEYSGNQKYQNITPGKYTVGSMPLTQHFDINSTCIHELGHVFGLPDYYRYENIPENDNGRGMEGDAGYLMMDDSIGDMSAFDKLMTGWYTTDEVQVYRGGTQTFKLRCSQQAPSCLLIPRGELGDYRSEYFIVEYADDTANNTAGFFLHWDYTLRMQRMFTGGGIRVLHCDAEVEHNFWKNDLKWQNYGTYYDKSNEKQRVLRLVNNKGGFFSAGAEIDSQTEGFAWYAADGYPTAPTGIKIHVDSIENGIASVTVTQK